MESALRVSVISWKIRLWNLLILVYIHKQSHNQYCSPVDYNINVGRVRVVVPMARSVRGKTRQRRARRDKGLEKKRWAPGCSADQLNHVQGFVKRVMVIPTCTVNEGLMGNWLCRLIIEDWLLGIKKEESICTWAPISTWVYVWVRELTFSSSGPPPRCGSRNFPNKV